ncbi:MAG: cytochrome P450 [Acidimicrobiales bacterium]
MLRDDLDPTSVGLFTRPDYYDLLAELRRESPVHRFAPGSWTVARHADVRAVSRDPDRFCSGHGVLMHDPLRSGGRVTGSILHMDPPEHGDWRKLVSRRFTPRSVAKLKGRIRLLARQVLAATPADREIDFVERVAAPLPVMVIAELLGIEGADVARFRRLSDATIEAPDNPGQGLEELTELFRLLVDHVHARRAEPREDLTSLLAAAQVDGRSLNTEEVVGYCLALLVAGNETTRHLLSGSVLALHERPEQRELLVREPSRMANAVEECLRWVCPIQAFGRTATRDTRLGGQPIQEGDFLVLLYASANRDEDVFGPDAAQFDVARPFDSPHLAFGFGEHLCVGAALARLEARVLLEELLAAHPGYRVSGEPQWAASTLVRGMRTLTVSLS